MQALVAGAVVFAERGDLPRLAGEPRQHADLDRAEVGADQDVPPLGAERGARQLSRNRERIAPASKLGVVAGDERIDQIGRVLRVVALKIV